MTDDPKMPSDETGEGAGFDLEGGGMNETLPASGYKVLARKYRPNSFTDNFIGHDAMVKTLENAFEADRIAHAFILTGVRGIGKTTTARILARALNYSPKGTGNGKDGGPSIRMEEEGEHCQAIIEGRHMDVIEMDAASRTGIGDVREIIDSVRFLPVSARYKVYIIDEVHMLSTAAFNGLLKTLEEPPEHVKFIFATTEIRKVPVTVLSRCQRFDLKRVDGDALVAFLSRIAGYENASVQDAGLKLIARAAEGSIRDGLSLLDQAIALGSGEEVTELQVRDMLGLADRARVVDLFELLMKGDVAAALGELRGQYDAGADPAVVLSDLLEFTHWMTRLKVAASAADDATATEAERERGKYMAAELPIQVLTRTWQLLLKGLDEVRRAPVPITAAEMILIRLCYAADLPAPGDLVKQLTQGGAAGQTGVSQGGAPQGGGARAQASGGMHSQAGPQSLPSAAPDGQPRNQARNQARNQPRAQLSAVPTPVPEFARFADLLRYLEKNRDLDMLVHLKDHVHLVSFEVGHIELRLGAKGDRKKLKELEARLRDLTGQPWEITFSQEEGAPTVISQIREAALQRLEEAKQDPLVKAALEIFPDAEIVSVVDRADDLDEFAAPNDDGDDDDE